MFLFRLSPLLVSMAANSIAVVTVFCRTFCRVGSAVCKAALTFLPHTLSMLLIFACMIALQFSFEICEKNCYVLGFHPTVFACMIVLQYSFEICEKNCYVLGFHPTDKLVVFPPFILITFKYVLFIKCNIYARKYVSYPTAKAGGLQFST